MPTAESRLPLLQYDAAFAERFRLPQAGITVLGPGLRAIALEVQPDRATGRMDCLLHLHLDASLDVALPADPRGVRLSFLKGTGPLFHVAELAGDDAAHARDQLSDYIGFLLVRTAPAAATARTGFSDRPVIAWYDREVLPELTQVTFDLVCESLDPANTPVEGWMRRANAPADALGEPERHPEQVWRFELPEALLRSAWPDIEDAGRHNQALAASVYSASPPPPPVLFRTPEQP